MSRREMLMSLGGGSSEQIGIFTKGYEATLTPGSTSEFVITHNMGVLPRVCFIEMDRSTAQATNYLINAVIDFDAEWIRDDKTGAYNYMYHYSNTDSTSGGFLPNTIITADETTITLKALYSAARSPWDTNADYNVKVWG